MNFGPVALTVMPKLEVDTQPRPVKPLSPPGKLTLVVKEGAQTPVELTWNDIDGIDYFKVYRDGKLIVETAVNFYPDVPPSFKAEYVVEAFRDSQPIARSESVTYKAPDKKVTEEIHLNSHINQSGVILSWPKIKSPHIVSYQIFRYPDVKIRTAMKFIGEIPASRSIGHSFRDKPPAGKWVYTVMAANAYKSLGSANHVTIEYPPKSTKAPAIELPLDKPPKGVKVTGRVEFGDKGAWFADGYIEIAHQSYMNLGRNMTLSFEFNTDSTDDSPVLICHGKWPTHGWFVQILGHHLIIRTPQGDARGPRIEKGKWYAVRFVFDGHHPHLKVNDKWYDQEGTIMQPVPMKTNLVIGQYIRKLPQHAYRGYIRNLKIVNDALLETTNG